MVRGQGSIGLFTIASIFVVVFAVMYGGVLFSNGELLPDRDLDEQEQRIRVSTWSEIDQLRADHGLQPARRSVFDSVAAQGTAVEFASAGITNSLISPTNQTTQGFTLTNGGPYCAQIAVSIPVEGSSESTGETAAMALESVDDERVLYRGAGYVNGIGVVVENRTAFLVYRTCAIKTP